MSRLCYGCMEMKESVQECPHCGFDEQSQNSPHQLPLGTVVGDQYILGRVLGQGGFGITYMAYDRIMKQRVAVKEYFPSGHAGRDTRSPTRVSSYDTAEIRVFEENKRRFLREAEALAKLWDIPQIVRVLRYFEDNGTAYIAMEYVEGMELKKYLRSRGRPMNMEEIFHILGPVMKALAHVHGAELVHRDISPDNIMVMADGSAKLLDFGAARYVENASADKERNTSTQAILKYGFAPPEQYRSRGALGPWTDVYALCATIYFCMTGKVPVEAMGRVVDDTPIGWESVPGLSNRQIAALNAGMELKPKARTKSVDALYAELFSEILAKQEKARRAEETEKKRMERKQRIAKEREAAREHRQQEQRKAKESESTEEKEALPPNAEEETEKQTTEQPRKAEKRTNTEFLKSDREKPVTDSSVKERPQKNGESRRKLWIAVAAVVIMATAGLFLMKTWNVGNRPLSGTGIHNPGTSDVGEPVWKNNVLMVQLGYQNGDFDAWYMQNKDNILYTDVSVSQYDTFRRLPLSDGTAVDITEEGYLHYLGSRSVFGSEVLRREVSEIIFLDTLAHAPESAWDVSMDQNGSVQAWAEPRSEGKYALTIAADGGINGVACDNLFFGFTELENVRFNGCFHTEEADSMRMMFFACASLKTLDLSGLDSSRVSNMAGMFSGCLALTELELSGLDTSSVTDMNCMFFDCASLEKLNVNSFNTSNVTNMYAMFCGCSALSRLSLTSFDTSSVVDMGEMFNGCSSLKSVDLSSFRTVSVTNMGWMFRRCSSLKTLDLSSFQTASVENMEYMFSECSALETLDTRGFTTEKLRNKNGMFMDCDNLSQSYRQLGTRIEAPSWQDNVLIHQTGGTAADFDAWYERNKGNPLYTDYEGKFRYYMETLSEEVIITDEGFLAYWGSLPVFGTNIVREQISEIDFLDSRSEAPEVTWDVSANQDRSVLAWTKPDGKGMYILTIAADGGINGRDACAGLFKGFVNLERIVFNECFYTDEVQSMCEMFAHCPRLTDLELSSLNTESVTDMREMFFACYDLKKLDLSSMDTSSVTNMCQMFYKCRDLTDLNLNGWDTSAVTNMGSMFSECFKLASLDLSSFDTGAVQSMAAMFSNAFALTSLDLHHFDTSSVTDMSYMFWYCSALESLDISGFSSESLVNSDDMFTGCDNLPEEYKQIGLSWFSG